MDDLWAAFNAYRLRCTNISYRRSLTQNKRYGRQLGEFEAWCRARDINPRRWMLAVFTLKRWGLPPSLNRLVPKSGTYEKKIRAVYDGPLKDPYEEQVSRDQKKREGRVYDPLTDLTATTENRKAGLVLRGQAQRCFDSIDETLGYHPGSAVCVLCPLRAQCGTTLNHMVGFDVVGIRTGTADARQEIIKRASI